MDLKFRNIILDNIEQLVTIIHDINEIVDKLQKMYVLNEHMVKHLQKYHELRKRTEEFFLMMLGRGPKAFDCLIAVLRETSNFRAEKILSDYKILEFEYSAPYTPECPPIDELDIGELGDSSINVVVKKHPDNKFMDSNEENGPIGAYRMRSNPRGHALIVNQFETYGEKDRLGSDVDFRKLEKLWTELGFKVFARQNLTNVEIKQEIAARKADPALANVDSFVAFFMGHGRQGAGRQDELLAKNGEPIDTNWIVEEFQFNGSTFNNLRGKPKMFFFQACRLSQENEKKNNNTIVRQNKDIETDSELMSSKDTCKDYQFQRDYEDTFVGYSTVPGKVSIRDPETGSWFVDAFCQVIAENSWQYDLDVLWVKMDELIKQKKCSRGYQTPEMMKRGFNKKLFFNPHLYE